MSATGRPQARSGATIFSPSSMLPLWQTKTATMGDAGGVAWCFRRELAIELEHFLRVFRAPGDGAAEDLGPDRE
jgi:hypothetical protein